MTMADTSGKGPVEARDVSRSVHALFDTREDAEHAREDLVAAGIPVASITIDGEPGGGEPAAAEGSGGFWDRLLAPFMPDDDRVSYAEGLRRGGFAIAVRTDTTNYDRVIEILDRDGAVDIDQRQESWRAEGWTGYTGRGGPLSENTSSPLGSAIAEEEPIYTPASAATAGFGASEADHFLMLDVSAPPIESPGALPPEMLEGQPDLQVKASEPDLRPAPEPTAGSGWLRDLSHGRTRVRSYVANDEAGPRIVAGRDA